MRAYREVVAAAGLLACVAAAVVVCRQPGPDLPPTGPHPREESAAEAAEERLDLLKLRVAAKAQTAVDVIRHRLEFREAVRRFREIHRGDDAILLLSVRSVYPAATPDEAYARNLIHWVRAHEVEAGDPNGLVAAGLEAELARHLADGTPVARE